jgi:uncharacterized protein
VANPHHLLRLNVGFIVNQPIGYSRDFHFDYSNLHLKPDLDLATFQGVARIGRTPQGLLVIGKFASTLATQCVRCLIDFNLELQIEFSELYAFSPRSMSESGLILPEDGNLDLEPIVREYLLIELPISPLCRPDCKGLCTICGEDLNQTTCEHQSQKNARIIS